MECLVDTRKVLFFAGVLLAVAVCVIAAILIDLWDGVHTARATGRRVHSHRLRVTAAKICEYGRFVAVGFLVDCLGFFFSWYPMPFTAVLFGAGLIGVEVKSMFEHSAERRSQASRLGDVLKSIVDCAHERDARRIVGMLTKGGVE